MKKIAPTYAALGNRWFAKKRQTIPLTTARCQRACCMTCSRTTSAAEILYMVSETNLAFLHFIEVREGGRLCWRETLAVSREMQTEAGKRSKLVVVNISRQSDLFETDESLVCFCLRHRGREVRLCVCVSVLRGWGSLLHATEENTMEERKWK